MLGLQQRATAGLNASRRAVLASPVRHVAHRWRAVRTMAAAADASDPTGCFISQFTLQGAASGPLAGLTLAVKDLYDIAGHKTGFGSPSWLQTHPTADVTAPPVAALLDAGAVVVGKTHMDELAYSLMGQNAHYGTPVNVAAPGRVPGGSSSGSAAAVAAGQADIGLGSDTGGSVRVPGSFCGLFGLRLTSTTHLCVHWSPAWLTAVFSAHDWAAVAAGQAYIGLGSDTGGSVRVPGSFCGLFGLRPTHGRISLEHARPLAASYDTCGWFARDAALLQRVGQVLLQHPTTQNPTPLPRFKLRWLVAKDAFAVADPAATQAIYDALAGPRFEKVQAVLGAPSEVQIAGNNLAADGLQELSAWVEAFRITQAYEIWQEHGAWVKQSQPHFGPGVADRFKMASEITQQEQQAAATQRDRIKQHVRQLLGSDGLLALPTAPGPAIACDATQQQQNEFRKGLLSLTCIAGLAGLPQVTLPLAAVDGMPVGLSLIGPAGSDEQLLEVAVQLAAAVQD
ncbi:hypothetical protein OEZ85_000727 [Tetradesmus obliquus]|uniref:Amidase domain-containing protein n=1 Tax=Tetradesmus obliquus TaxID=3088 RepID=A0ABY8UPI8_TETOB|nr:hypothetical protein OEZ85_000727 [Tetradesmus obliquus]